MDAEIPLKGVPSGLYRNPGRWRSDRPLHGPLRALRLCILSALLPGILIALPLYMRYYVYRNQLYPLGMSDMRLIDGKVSTTWCQKQVVHSNVTFNAFLMEGSPSISAEMMPVSMTRHLTLSDDMKEYWAFYLLKESVVTVSTCVRWPGASLVVIRGHRHLHECAFIGDDSSEEAEELDEIKSNERRNKPPRMMDRGVVDQDGAPSNNPGMMMRHRSDVVFHHEDNHHTNQTIPAMREERERDDDLQAFVGRAFPKKPLLRKKTRSSSAEEQQQHPEEHVHKHRELSVGEQESSFITFARDKEREEVLAPQKSDNVTSSEVLDDFLNRLKFMGDRGQMILERLNEKLNTKSKDVGGDGLEQEKVESMNRLKRRAYIERSTMEQLFNEDDEKGDNAMEEGLAPDGIADHHGILNETTLNDRSNSEFWSSFSSSEEALLNCAGLILSLPLTPSKKCDKHSSPEDLGDSSLINAVTYRVHSNGYYFFVFSSENEVQDNFIQVHFNINRSVYNVSNPVAECRNSTNMCSLPLNFFSDEKLVLELPMNGNESLSNKEYIVVSECEPRTAIYVVCVVAVPLVIIVFAFQ